MKNPWETGDRFQLRPGVTIHPAHCDVRSRLDAAQHMSESRLRQCLAWPDTQKTVRLHIQRLLRQIEKRRGA